MQEHLFFIDYLVRILEENWHMIYIPYDQIWLLDQTHDQTLPTSLSKALQWGDSNCLTAEYQHILMLPKDPESNITSTLDLLKIICLIVFFVPILLFVTLLACSRSQIQSLCQVSYHLKRTWTSSLRCNWRISPWRRHSPALRSGIGATWTATTRIKVPWRHRQWKWRRSSRPPPVGGFFWGGLRFKWISDDQWVMKMCDFE